MKLTVYNSIQDVPEADWNQLASGESLAHSRALWCVLENSGIKPFSNFRHALIYNVLGRPIALLSYYTVLTDLAIFSTGWRKCILQQIRRLFPTFLKVRMLECGNPLILNFPLVIAKEASTTDVIITLLSHLSDTARKEGHFMIVIRDFAPAHAKLESLFEQQGFTLVEGLPTTFMNIQWESVSAFLASMRSRYRHWVMKYIRDNEAKGVRGELVDLYDKHAETFYEQWQVVHMNAKDYQREMLTPAFYRLYSRELDENAKILLIWKVKELVGHILLMLDGPVLRALFFGRNSAASDGLYIYALYKAVEAAIELKSQMLELGLTTYPIKTQLGASMCPQRYALRATWLGVSPLIRLLYPILNQVPEIQMKNVFKNKSHIKHYMVR